MSTENNQAKSKSQKNESSSGKGQSLLGEMLSSPGGPEFLCGLTGGIIYGAVYVGNAFGSEIVDFFTTTIPEGFEAVGDSLIANKESFETAALVLLSMVVASLAISWVINKADENNNADKKDPGIELQQMAQSDKEETPSTPSPARI